MTVIGTVKTCMLKEHGKSARLELVEKTTPYTLFDVKHVPALQPGCKCKFEITQRSYKDKDYWAVVDGSMRVKALAASDDSVSIESFFASGAPTPTGPERVIPPHPGRVIIVLERIAELGLPLERIADALEAIARSHDKKTATTLEDLADKEPEFDDDIPF